MPPYPVWDKLLYGCGIVCLIMVAVTVVLVMAMMIVDYRKRNQ